MATNNELALEEPRPTRLLPFLHANLNVGPAERVLCALGGGALVFLGLRKGLVKGAALTTTGASLLFRAARGHCPVYQALGYSTAPTNPNVSVPAKQGVRVEKSIIVNRPARELHDFWRDLQNLPGVMSHIESVVKIDDDRSHWVAKGPLGSKVEWDAEVINEIPGELIAWRSLEGSTVDSAGSVHFQELPGGRGTRVSVTLKYNPPAGKLGAAVSKLLGEDPEKQIREDLRRFRQLMESGEIPNAASQSSAGARS